MHEMSEELALLPQDQEPYATQRFPVWHPEMNAYRRAAYVVAGTVIGTVCGALVGLALVTL